MGKDKYINITNTDGMLIVGTDFSKGNYSDYEIRTNVGIITFDDEGIPHFRKWGKND